MEGGGSYIATYAAPGNDSKGRHNIGIKGGYTSGIFIDGASAMSSGPVIITSPEARFGTHDLGNGDDPVNGLVLLECLTYLKTFELYNDQPSDPRVSLYFFDGPQVATETRVKRPITTATTYLKVDATNPTQQDTFDGSDRTPRMMLPNGRRTTGCVIEPGSDAWVSVEGELTTLAPENALPGVSHTIITDGTGAVRTHGRDSVTTSATWGPYLLDQNYEDGAYLYDMVSIHMGVGGGPAGGTPSMISALTWGAGAGMNRINTATFSTDAGDCACRNNDSSVSLMATTQIDTPTGHIHDSNEGDPQDIPNGIQLSSGAVDLPAPWEGVKAGLKMGAGSDSPASQVGIEFIRWADGFYDMGVGMSTRNLRRVSEDDGGPLDPLPEEVGPWQPAGGCLRSRNIHVREDWKYQREAIVRSWHRYKDVFDKEGYEAAMAAHRANMDNPEVDAIKAQIESLEARAEAILAGVKFQLLASLAITAIEGAGGRTGRSHPGKVTEKGGRDLVKKLRKLIQEEAGDAAEEAGDKAGAAAGGAKSNDTAEAVQDAKDMAAEAAILRAYLAANFAENRPSSSDFTSWGEWQDPSDELFVRWVDMTLSRKVRHIDYEDCDSGNTWRTKTGEVIDWMGQEAEWKRVLADDKEWKR